MTTWAVAVVPDGADAGRTGAAGAAANDCAGTVADEDAVRGSSWHSLLSM